MSLVIAAVALHRFTELLRHLGSIPTGTDGVAILFIVAGARRMKATPPTLYVTP